MTRKKILLLLSPLILVIVLFVVMVAAGITPIALQLHDPIAQSGGIAIDGFDPVSFRMTPQKGSAKHAYEWNGATWHFADEVNLNTFKTNPEKYCPAFGGHCALATSTGFAVTGEPGSYEVIADTLYFFAGDEVRETYKEDLKANLAKSRAAWK